MPLAKDRKAYSKDAETAINWLILKEIEWWNLREYVVSWHYEIRRN